MFQRQPFYYSKSIDDNNAMRTLEWYAVKLVHFCRAPDVGGIDIFVLFVIA